jgi:hypothetical protein
MGMGLFYVTVFAIFFLWRIWAAIAVFAVFFEGGSGNSHVFMWCFCGEGMVDCVVVVERRHHVAPRLKTRHEFGVYFRVRRGKAAEAIPFWEWCTKGPKGARFFGLPPGPFSL